MDNKAYQNIIINLGQMIVNFQPQEYLRKLGYTMEIAQTLAGVVFKDEIFERVDRGEFTLFEGVKLFSKKRPDLSADITKILTTEWFSVIKENQPFISLLQELHDQGKHLFIAAIFAQDGMNYMRNKYDFFKLFEDVVVSSEIKSTEPGQFYRTLIENNHLKIDSTVVTDWNHNNLTAATEIGLKTIQYTDVESLRNALS
jgi:putative hydrolase of the HAD superfamily